MLGEQGSRNDSFTFKNVLQVKPSVSSPRGPLCLFFFPHEKILKLFTDIQRFSFRSLNHTGEIR